MHASTPRTVRARGHTFALSAMLAFVVPALAQTKYHVTDLGTLPGGAKGDSAGSSINSPGPGAGSVNTPPLVVGSASGARATANAPAQLPFIWSKPTGMLDASAGLALWGIAHDVNAAGWYCGQMLVHPSDALAPRKVAFLGSTISNSILYLPALGGKLAVANALNESRATVGAAQTADGSLRATLWPAPSNGLPPAIALGTLGGKMSEALGINNRAWIVGWAENAAGARRAFVSLPGDTGAIKPGPMIDLGSLVKTGNAAARDVNLAGQIVGWSSFPASATDAANSATRAVLWMIGNSTLPTIKNLGVLRDGDRSSDALGNNARGQVVGWSGGGTLTSLSKPSQRAFLWENGVMIDLNTRIPADSGWHLVAASEINDAGMIVGWGRKNSANSANAVHHAFLLTPANP